jgi:spore maturation protein CgeB
MKIAYIYCGSAAASWSSSDGITATLRKMGHQVLAYARGRDDCPPLQADALNMADAIIVSGPEHIFLQHLREGQDRNEYALQDYELTIYEWKNEIKPPKLFMYHESNSREDRTFGFEDLLSYGDYHFFPAIQDAETFDGEAFAPGRSFWLPIAVDTDVFHPTYCAACKNGVLKSVCKECLGTGYAPNFKTIPTGFVGMIYQKRNAYLHQMASHMKRGRDPDFIVGSVFMRDMEGVPWREQAQRLAQNYRKVQVFVNLPSYSELLVSKVYEVMACGTFLLTPIITGAGQANCKQFEHAKELAYYQSTNVPFLVQAMREFAGRPELCEQIGKAGLAAILEGHTLKQFLTEMLSKIEKPAKVEVIQ